MKSIHYVLPALLLICAIVTYGQNIESTRMEDDSLKRAGIQVFHYNGETLLYKKPKLFGFITQVPRTFSDAAKETFTKKSLLSLSIIAGSSLLLIAVDQPIKNGVTKFSNYIHLDPERKYKTLLHFKLGSTPVNVYDKPQNFNSVLYSIGEGSTTILICAGLVTFGKIKKDNRALQTASQVMQAQIGLGITTQLLKRMAGRQSPFASTQDGGRWRPFTNPGTYQKTVSSYDAFPSGHLATMVATTVVIADNYPEKKWIRPVGYGMTGVVGLAMINNGVHWAGDYPLAIGIGYLFGKVTVKMNRWIKGEKTRK
jgi:hypothetical protein